MKKVLIAAFLMLNFCVNAHSSNLNLSTNANVNPSPDSLYAGMSHSQFTRYSAISDNIWEYYSSLFNICDGRLEQLLTENNFNEQEFEHVFALETQISNIYHQYKNDISNIEDQKCHGNISADELMNQVSVKASDLLGTFNQKRIEIIAICPNATTQTLPFHAISF